MVGLGWPGVGGGGGGGWRGVRPTIFVVGKVDIISFKMI